jgi:hypothetical protein
MPKQDLRLFTEGMFPARGRGEQYPGSWLLMGIRKMLMLPAVLSFSAVFAFVTLAQQEDSQVNDKVRELQQQWNQLMKNEYNPSAIQPKTKNGPSFGSSSSWSRSSKKSAGKRSRHHSRWASKKRHHARTRLAHGKHKHHVTLSKRQLRKSSLRHAKRSVHRAKYHAGRGKHGHKTKLTARSAKKKTASAHSAKKKALLSKGKSHRNRRLRATKVSAGKRAKASRSARKTASVSKKGSRGSKHAKLVKGSAKKKAGSSLKAKGKAKAQAKAKAKAKGKKG